MNNCVLPCCVYLMVSPSVPYAKVDEFGFNVLSNSDWCFPLSVNVYMYFELAILRQCLQECPSVTVLVF